MRDAKTTGQRLRRKDRKRLEVESRPLPRRRAYRAAQEVLEQGIHLWKMADNKTRLALMLLGPLNALLLALLANTEIFDPIPQRERMAIMVGVVIYTILAMAMFGLAIVTLRPEETKPLFTPPQEGDHDSPLGIRHHEDILRQDIEGYTRAWQKVTRAQLVAEIAEQAHAVAEANQRKFRTLYYLFQGLRGMFALAVVLMVLIGGALLLRGDSEQIRLKHGVKLTIPAIIHPSSTPIPAAEGAGGGSGRDWARFPPVVDLTTKEEVVALGDIHGTFDRLVHLLEVNGLMRADPKAPGRFAWTGGKRTLVSVGDLIDKGPQSLEVLDLMMSLQRQAAAAGGAVIITLGNHEAEFLARPGKKKAIEFERELDARGIDFRDVAAGKSPYGQFMLNLPLAARVNGWFFSHGGSTSGQSLKQLGQHFREVVDSGRWKNPFLVGDDSVLEARKWWKGGDDVRDLAALPAGHIVFGHDPGAFKDKGTIQARNDGRLFLIDVGMTRAFDYSKGALLFIDRKDGQDVATSVDASGTRKELWRGPAPRS
jgi:hypothetical protein